MSICRYLISALSKTFRSARSEILRVQSDRLQKGAWRSGHCGYASCYKISNIILSCILYYTFQKKKNGKEKCILLEHDFLLMVQKSNHQFWLVYSLSHKFDRILEKNRWDFVSPKFLPPTMMPIGNVTPGGLIHWSNKLLPSTSASLWCKARTQNPYLWPQTKTRVLHLGSRYTLQGINISHLGKRKIIFKMPFLGDMLVPWRVYIPGSSTYVKKSCLLVVFFCLGMTSTQILHRLGRSRYVPYAENKILPPKTYGWNLRCSPFWTGKSSEAKVHDCGFPC